MDPYLKHEPTQLPPSADQERAAAAKRKAPTGFDPPADCPGCNAPLKPEGKSVVVGVVCPHCGYDLENKPRGMGAGQHADAKGLR